MCFQCVYVYMLKVALLSRVQSALLGPSKPFFSTVPELFRFFAVDRRLVWFVGSLTVVGSGMFTCSRSDIWFRIGVGSAKLVISTAKRWSQGNFLFFFVFRLLFSVRLFALYRSLSFSFAIAFGHAQRIILSKNESSTLLTSFLFFFGHSRNCCGDKQEFMDGVFRSIVASLALYSLVSTQFFISFCLVGFPMRLLGVFRLILVYLLCGPERFYCFGGEEGGGSATRLKQFIIDTFFSETFLAGYRL